MRPFVYQRAGDVAAAVTAASQGKSSDPPTMAAAQYLAGGTTILDLMKLDVMRPEVLVDVATVDPAGSRIERRADAFHLGAFVTMAQAADHPDIERDYPVIAKSARPHDRVPAARVIWRQLTPVMCC